MPSPPPSTDFAGAAKSTYLAFEVADVPRAMAELRERGVTFETYRFPWLKAESRGTAGVPGVTGGWFKDPDGTILSVRDGPFVDVRLDLP